MKSVPRLLLWTLWGGGIVGWSFIFYIFFPPIHCPITVYADTTAIVDTLQSGTPQMHCSIDSTVSKKNAAPNQTSEIKKNYFPLPVPQLSSCVHINTAQKDELDALPGIGPVLAERIIAYRTTHGKFEAISEIISVKGVGKKKFEKIRPMICL